MPGKRAIIDFNKCDPTKCGDGHCLAALACPRKMITQEKLLEPPIPYPAACRGCSDCVGACSLKAIFLSGS
ncbi:hypothetical protein ACFLYV_04360 [Chloroflexota bacterium]